MMFLASSEIAGQWTVLIDLLVLLGAALLLGTIAEQLRQSAILGYLMAGTLAGPNVLGVVASPENVEMISEVGVSLLLFSVGLEFSFGRLRSLGPIALVGGALQVTLTGLVVGGLAWQLGASGKAATALGAMVSLSSTACVVRLLIDRTAMDSVYGRNAVGMLLFQDVAVVPLTLLITALAGTGTAGEVSWTILKTVGLGGLMVGSFYLLFNHVVPRLLNIRRWSRNRELPILLAVVIAGGSTVAARAVDISPAMGAFIAGMLMAESPFAVQIRSDIGSLRTVMVTVFFASIGMLGDPVWIAGHWPKVILAVGLIVIIKPLVVWLIARKLGYTHGHSLATGLCLAHVGEFSFVLGAMAKGTILQDEMFQLVISAMIVSLFLTPFLIDLAPRAAGWIERRLGASSFRPAPAHAGGAGQAGSTPAPDDVSQIVATREGIILIGFGPAGQRVVDHLKKRHLGRVTVVELNPRNAEIARQYGLNVQLGDGQQQDVLEHAGLHRAAAVVITLPDPVVSRHLIHLCRAISPEAKILVRARYHVYRWELQFAGAEVVIDEEEEVGIHLASEVNKHLRTVEREQNREAAAPKPEEPPAGEG